MPPGGLARVVFAFLASSSRSASSIPQRLFVPDIS